MNWMNMVLLIVVTIGALALYFVIPRFIIDTKTYARKVAHSYQPFEIIQVLTRDDIALHGCIHKVQKPKGLIILLHGIRGSTSHFTPLIYKLEKQGYSSVTIDLRAHNKSGGTYCTFGYKEKQDIQDLVSHLLSMDIQTTNIGIWGQSLGGAISLQALAIEPRLKFGIIESTFSDFRTIVYDYALRLIPFKMNWFHDFLIYRASKIADFDPDKITPGKSAQNITQPILIAHGTHDKRIKIAYGKDIYNNLACTQKRFVPVKNANHMNLWQVGSSEYFETIDIFLHSLQ